MAAAQTSPVDAGGLSGEATLDAGGMAAAGNGGQHAGAKSPAGEAQPIEKSPGPERPSGGEAADAGIPMKQLEADGGSASNAADAPAATTQTACPGGAVPADETCDNRDEDCDGRVDENVTQSCGTSAREPCKLGTQVCTAGQWSACSGAIEPTQEVCDADHVDEDCDGQVNEGCDCVPGATIACGVNKGSCRAGVQQCNSAGKFDAVCVGEVGPQPERCDGRADEDCDGLDDADDPDCECIDGQMQECRAVGLGVCSQGQQTCSNGKWGRCIAKQLGCVCDDSQPARDCGSSSMGACHLGKQRCAQGQWSTCEGDVNPTTEKCDGTDSDCDGIADAMDSDAQRSCGSGSTCDGTRCVNNAPPPTAPGKGFRNGKSSLCIGISEASTANGALAGQFNCDGTSNQHWEERSVGSNVNLVNKKSGLCLGVSGGSTADGAQIGQFNCDPARPDNNQAWHMKPLSSGFFQIVNGKSGKCIGVDGGSTANGASLLQFPCSTDGAINNQSWTYAN